MPLRRFLLILAAVLLGAALTVALASALPGAGVAVLLPLALAGALFLRLLRRR